MNMVKGSPLSAWQSAANTLGQVISVMSLLVMIEEELDMFPCGLNHVSSSAWHTTNLGIAQWTEHFISQETQVLWELCAIFDERT
jgi:hypothetical protein